MGTDVVSSLFRRFYARVTTLHLNIGRNLYLSWNKLDRARQSFRQSLRMANLRRGRTLGPPTTTEESLTPSPSGRLSPSMTAETERLSQSVAVPSTSSAVAPLASPEDQVPLTIPHAASMDGLSGSRRPTPEPMPKPPARSATCSVRPTTILMPFKKRKMSLPMESGSTAGLFSFEAYQEFPTFYHRFKAATGNLLSVAATRNHVVKCFPNTSSESDLQKYRTSSVWDPAPSLSNIAAESLRHKYSIPDNGSAKFFQGALHTPNMGEKVAQFYKCLSYQMTCYSVSQGSYYANSSISD
nr:uncharacterized protein LOC106688204 [Halyomorpha halys]